MATSNTSDVDLESVLNVRRRTLVSIGETTPTRFQSFYTDTIYLKRQDCSNSIFSIDSKVLIFGELQLLSTIFERYTSSIIVYEESADSNTMSPSASKLPTVSTVEENDDDVEEGLPIVSTLHRTSLTSKGSSSPPRTPGSPTSPSRKKTISSIGRSQTVGGAVTEYAQNLEGKRYGCIEIPTMSMIEILEILFRVGLELVDVLGDYDNENVLHQNFVFSKVRQTGQKHGGNYSRKSSMTGT